MIPSARRRYLLSEWSGTLVTPADDKRFYLLFPQPHAKVLTSLYLIFPCDFRVYLVNNLLHCTRVDKIGRNGDHARRHHRCVLSKNYLPKNSASSEGD